MTVSIHDLHTHRNFIAAWASTKGAKCSAPNEMRNASSNEEAFKVLFTNYYWATMKGFSCPELDSLKHTDLSPWYVWILESYCLDRGADDVVIPVINLHKRIVAGEQVTEQEWDATRATTWAAARDPARVTTWDAAWTAAMGATWNPARDTAWAAARDSAWAAASDAAIDAAWAAARNAAWTTASAFRNTALSHLYNQIISLHS